MPRRLVRGAEGEGWIPQVRGACSYQSHVTAPPLCLPRKTCAYCECSLPPPPEKRLEAQLLLCRRHQGAGEGRAQIPRFAFEKFPGSKAELTTQMKSVGEAMAMGRTFQESFQKAMRSLETGLDGWSLPRNWKRRTRQELEYGMRVPNPDRMLIIKQVHCRPAWCLPCCYLVFSVSWQLPIVLRLSASTPFVTWVV